MLAAVNLRELGARVRLHAADGDDLGLAYAPAPVELGDVLAPAETAASGS
jgi:hypothetical protein